MDLLNLEIRNYLHSHSSSESKLLSKLRRETELKCLNPIMLSGEFQGNFLSIISKIKNPKTVLEIGTYTGYSTLCIAQGLDKNGTIHTIDKNEELIEIQNKYFGMSDFREHIKQYTGEALKIIPSIKLKFDLIFLDADKENYSNYLNIISPLLNKNGILISDNVLWHGKILEENSRQDITTKLIDEFNKNILKDESLQSIMLPIRDGISISIKL